MTISEYNTCVDQYADGLYRFVLKNIKDEEIAKDVIQDTFEKTWEKIENISYEKAKSYLFTTAYHITLDTLKKEKRTQHWDEEKTPEPYHDEQYNDVHEVVQKGLERLPRYKKMCFCSEIMRDMIIRRLGRFEFE